MIRIFLWLALLVLLCIPATQGRQNDFYLAQQEVAQLLKALPPALKKHYIFPEKIPNVEHALAEKIAAGQFSDAMLSGMLKIELEQLLISATDDSNFELLLQTNNLQSSHSNSNKQKSIMDFPDRYTVATEVSVSDIGVLSLKGNFLDLKALSDIAVAMSKLSKCKALIVDISQSGEGDLLFVQHLLSYWLAPETIVSELYSNNEAAPLKLYPVALQNKTDKRANIPTYIVTSPFVLGTWELFAYSLQQQGVAKIVGLETMGLAVLNKQITLSNQARLTLAHAIPIDPISGSNWHRTGVIPDYFVTLDEALETAHSLATQAVAFD